MLKRCKEAIRKIKKSAEQIKANPTIPENLKKKFYDINSFLITEIKKYDEAQKMLKSPYHRPGDLLARARAKKQIKDTKAFAVVLKGICCRYNVMTMKKGKKK